MASSQLIQNSADTATAPSATPRREPAERPCAVGTSQKPITAIGTQTNWRSTNEGTGIEPCTTT